METEVKEYATEIEAKVNEGSENGFKEKEPCLKLDDLLGIKSQSKLLEKLTKKKISTEKIAKIFEYEKDLIKLQIELVKFQRWVQEKKQRVAIIFEGRDAAGKGGAIRRFIEHMNPRAMRVVALPVPSVEETGQWYFQRYAKQLPNEGEIVFFDRSWYNRAVVEPVNGFCTKTQYKQFLRQVPEFEHMLYEDGIILIKFWFSISKEEQLKRFESRKGNPLKQWKLSSIDARAQELWDKYTHYKQVMFSRTHTSFSPWIIVRANTKKTARLESIRYVLSRVDYDGKDEADTSLIPDPNTIQRFHRAAISLD